LLIDDAGKPMSNLKILFVIDKVELRYFSFNKLVTNFWLTKESLDRGYDTYITTLEKLGLKENIPCAEVWKTKLHSSKEETDIVYDNKPLLKNLTEFKLVFFRPDPPVDIDYINATYILDYLDNTNTLVLNRPSGVRKANEKLYINNFTDFVPANITTSSSALIKEFLNKHREIIIKPLNKCFGKGVFYIKSGDKNFNSIVETATNYGSSVVMVQEFLKSPENADKRIILLGGKPMEQALLKISGEGDFKFNTHNDEYLKKAELTPQERKMCASIAPKLIEDGLYTAGLDVLNEKIIEINITSPCFFINEINTLFGVELEKTVWDYFEGLI